MEKENLVKTTWRIPENLYAEMQLIHERDKVSINSIGIARLQAASVNDRLDKIDKEMAAVKRMIREVLDRLETR